MASAPRPIDIMNRRRAQETLVEENVKRIVNINKVTSRAQWENDTDRVIASRRAAEVCVCSVRVRVAVPPI